MQNQEGCGEEWFQLNLWSKLQTLRTSVGLHVKEEMLLQTRSLICSRTLEDRRSGETRPPAPLDTYEVLNSDTEQSDGQFLTDSSDK